MSKLSSNESIEYGLLGLCGKLHNDSSNHTSSHCLSYKDETAILTELTMFLSVNSSTLQSRLPFHSTRTFGITSIVLYGIAEVGFLLVCIFSLLLWRGLVSHKTAYVLSATLVLCVMLTIVPALMMLDMLLRIHERPKFWHKQGLAFAATGL